MLCILHMRLLEGPLIEHAPVVFSPLGCAFTVGSPTAWSAILRAAGPACRIAASATPATLCVTFGLLNVCQVRTSAS